jgi:hypothetical protein
MKEEKSATFYEQSLFEWRSASKNVRGSSRSNSSI